MVVPYGYEKLYDALNECKKTHDVSYESSMTLFHFCRWLSDNSFNVYNYNKEGVFNTKLSTIVAKKPSSSDAEKEYLKDLICSFVKKVHSAKYVEDYDEGEEMKSIMEYAVKEDPEYFKVQTYEE